jgi:plastocyanin
MSSEYQQPEPEPSAAGERSERAAPGEAPPRKDQVWRQWMMVGVGLTALMSIMAIIVSVVALASDNQTTNTATQTSAPAAAMTASMGGSGGSMSTSTAAKPEAVKLVMKSDTEKAEKGPDGQYHDAVLPGNFTIHAGDRVTVTVYNYDDMPHSFTATDLSVNQTIRAGSENAPSKTTFTFTAPTSAGKYQWWCSMPCDPYSMSTDGLMKGTVNVAA